MNANTTTTATDNTTQESSLDIMEEFRAGVTATLRSWSALRAAVESQWGGTTSQEKANELRQHVYEVFASNKPTMDQYELEDNLAIYMEEQFSVVLEDDSERQVAAMLFQMYEQCLKGDVTLARQAVESAQRVEAMKNAYPVQVQSNDDDDDDDDESMSDSPQGSAAAQEYASASLFGTAKKEAPPPKPVRQLGEAAPSKPEEQVDEDGFTTVPTKQKRRNRTT